MDNSKQEKMRGFVLTLSRVPSYFPYPFREDVEIIYDDIGVAIPFN